MMLSMASLSDDPTRVMTNVSGTKRIEKGKISNRTLALSGSDSSVLTLSALLYSMYAELSNSILRRQ